MYSEITVPNNEKLGGIEYDVGKQYSNCQKTNGIDTGGTGNADWSDAQAVSRWESEAGLPDTSLIVPLVQALQISTDTLFGMDQMKQEDAMYMEIKREYEKIESDEKHLRMRRKKNVNTSLDVLR